jgi:hypothetical protein
MIKFIHDIMRPVCPRCDGSGGSEGYYGGYYGGDWTGCSLCNPNEDREETIVRIWFWRIWLHRIEMWRLDRWVDRQIKADKEPKT